MKITTALDTIAIYNYSDYVFQHNVKWKHDSDILWATWAHGLMSDIFSYHIAQSKIVLLTAYFLGIFINFSQNITSNFIQWDLYTHSESININVVQWLPEIHTPCFAIYGKVITSNLVFDNFRYYKVQHVMWLVGICVPSKNLRHRESNTVVFIDSFFVVQIEKLRRLEISTYSNFH